MLLNAETYLTEVQALYVGEHRRVCGVEVYTIHDLNVLTRYKAHCSIIKFSRGGKSKNLQTIQGEAVLSAAAALIDLKFQIHEEFPMSRPTYRPSCEGLEAELANDTEEQNVDLDSVRPFVVNQTGGTLNIRVEKAESMVVNRAGMTKLPAKVDQRLPYHMAKRDAPGVREDWVLTLGWKMLQLIIEAGHKNFGIRLVGRVNLEDGDGMITFRIQEGNEQVKFSMNQSVLTDLKSDLDGIAEDYVAQVLRGLRGLSNSLVR